MGRTTKKQKRDWIDQVSTDERLAKLVSDGIDLAQTGVEEAKSDTECSGPAKVATFTNMMKGVAEIVKLRTEKLKGDEMMRRMSEHVGMREREPTKIEVVYSSDQAESSTGDDTQNT